MSFFTGIWNSFLDVIAAALTALHDVLEPLFGFDAAWGWAIIGLTLIVRTLMLPLAIKQIRSMRGMQAIQPRVKEIQEKYKVDRDLMKKDPERYQKLKAQQNEKLMELYKEEGVNPASSCLPLLLQMPVFFALFRVLGDDSVEGLADAQFYFFTSFVSDDAAFEGLGASVSAAGWPGWLLIAMMAGTMFLTQRQMQARNTAEGPQATQQKIMMYVFPVFLAAISFNFPLAVVLYWVTTNIWQSVQQYVMLRTASEEEPPRRGDSVETPTPPPSPKPKTDPKGSADAGGSGGKGTKRGGQNRPKKKSSPSSGGSHLPRRKS
jgi:YidC/Oxa1 family membrane protein insertase